MRFEWDEKKNERNFEKHGISFQQAREVFEDPLHLSIIDHRFNYFEERWITIGKAEGEYIIVVAHLYYDIDNDECVRIISARKATSNERRHYENEQ